MKKMKMYFEKFKKNVKISLVPMIKSGSDKRGSVVPASDLSSHASVYW